MFARFEASSQRRTLPNRDYIYSVSEVTILNNDQHQRQKKQYQQTAGLILRLNKNTQTYLLKQNFTATITQIDKSCTL